MFGKNTKVTVRGESFDLAPLRAQDIVKGTLVRLKQGSTVRRVIAVDQGDVILRGVRSDSVLEAIPAQHLLDEWELLKPLDKSAH